MGFKIKYFKKYLITGIMLYISIAGNQLDGQNRSWLVDTTHLINAAVSPYNMIQPGDTVLLQPGVRNHLLIMNFNGTPDKPVIFMNNKGVVDINTGEYYGISIRNCRYFRLTGTGDPDNFYGIKISRVAAGAGIGIGSMSSDFEIDHISVENSPIGGIYAKTDPDCSFQSTRENFTQYNTVIHDNYIANVGNEGLYVGSTHYSGQTVKCNGRDTLLLPSLLEGVRIYNNIIMSPGWDGIQVSSASNNCQVYNNQIFYDSQAEYSGQMSGIMLGGGSKCDCFNNLISQGKGDGIESHGLGGYRIFNNIIVDAGLSFRPGDKSSMKHGIFVSDISVISDSSFFILFNDIINPKSDGIRFQSVKSRKSLIASNLIVNPGNYEYYEYGNTSFRGVDSYIMLPGSGSDVKMKNNFLTLNLSFARISSNDYSILPGSPLINKASSENRGVDFDFRNFQRPSGTSFDIGALEFDAGQVDVITPEDDQMQVVAYPDPAHLSLTVKYHSDFASVTELSVYNLNGILVHRWKNDAAADSEQELHIDTGNLSPGVYLYTLINGRSIAHGKFIKLK